MAKRKGLFASVARRPSHKPAKLLPKSTEGIPGPSPNPATNFMLADVAIRAGSYLARRGVEKGLLAGRYGKDTAKDIVINKTLGQSLISFALARLATRSVPGALVVGGGALAKSLLDRRKNRLSAKAEGDAKLLDQARDD
ncbi:hypothetical protein [Qipengyuania sediminis]|uniref:hypothetical protein n=1 Tax=Qipengyuania sediminis TaxID=1532023 RepID=UPI001F0EC5D3|nr:hypothetical protein [Qipengyuania sediminis]